MSQISLLENFISYCSGKNKIISKNIANIGTEGYKREDIEFKNLFQQNINPMIKTTNPKHLTVKSTPNNFSFEVTKNSSSDNVSGINNVDIDQEMSELAVNSLQFRFAARKIGDYFRGIQNVIKGGGRL